MCKRFSVKQFGAWLAVKALVVAILPRAARLDEQGVQLESLKPFANCRRRELGAIVKADVIGRPVQQEQIRQCLQYRLLILSALGADVEARLYGVHPTRTFEQAAVKYLEENGHKRLLDRDVYALQSVMPYIAGLPLDRVHDDALAKFKRDRQGAGRKPGTLNKELAVVRRILNLAARV